jgi:transcription antitermination factor NusG
MNAEITADLRAHALQLAAQHLQDSRAETECIVPQGPRAWFVLQTVMHGEEKVAEALKGMGFESYAPMMKRDVYVRRSRSMVTRTFRLFNRYLFARLPTDTAQWKTVEAVDELDCVLGANGIPAIVRDADIVRFRKAEAAHEFDLTKRERFPIGSRVRIVAGPFSGWSGQVRSVEGKRVVRAIIEILGGLTPVDFPWDAVVPG